MNKTIESFEPEPKIESASNLADAAIQDDLNTAAVLREVESILDSQIDNERIDPWQRSRFVWKYDNILGLNLASLVRTDLRIRPASATLSEDNIEARLTERKVARAAKDFATSDRIRDDLIAAGVEVMDGDPLGWDWKLDI